MKAGRLPADKLLPMQAGIGNVANAVMASFDKSPYEALDCYTEVIQDGMLGLIKDGTVDHASTTSLALSDDGIEELIANIDFYRDHITLRPQRSATTPRSFDDSG